MSVCTSYYSRNKILVRFHDIFVQCVCLVDATGKRTMLPCLSSAVRLQVLIALLMHRFNIELIQFCEPKSFPSLWIAFQANDLRHDHFRGSKVTIFCILTIHLLRVVGGSCSSCSIKWQFVLRALVQTCTLSQMYNLQKTLLSDTPRDILIYMHTQSCNKIYYPIL